MLGGTDVGGLCIVGSAAMWSLVARKLLPKVSRRVMQSVWWESGKSSQKRKLWDAGFPRAGASNGFPLGTTDAMAADMFGWFSLTGVVNLLGGTLTLPVVLLGWGTVGDLGQGAFLLAVFLVAGWSLLDAVDGVMRACLFLFFPTGCTGLEFQCPKRFWLKQNLLQHPFWLMLVLPMNARLPDLNVYHYLTSSLMVSTAYQHISGCERARVHLQSLTLCKPACVRARVCRQYSVTLDLADVRCLRRLKELVAVQLLSAASVRGALFIFLALSCKEQLRLHADPSTADMAAFPGLLMLVFNALVIIDAIKAAVWWLPARKQGTRAMRQEAITIPLTPADSAGFSERGTDDDLSPNRSRGRSRKPKAQVKEEPVTGEGVSEDELVFGGEDGRDDRGEMSPADASAEGELHPRADELLFGCRCHTRPDSSNVAASHTPYIPGNDSYNAPGARAESVVFPSTWKGQANEDGAEDHFSNVSVPITPLERQLRTANLERDKRAEMERQETRARSEALKEADRRRDKSATRPPDTERRKAEEERHWRRSRDKPDAQRPAQQDTHGRGGRVRKEAERPAETRPGATEAPPMVDHDSIFQTGCIPRCVPAIANRHARAPRLYSPPPSHWQENTLPDAWRGPRRGRSRGEESVLQVIAEVAP